MEIRSAAEENYIKADPYHVGFYYILMSTSQLPRKPVGKIFCKKGLIKWAYSAKVCFALKERVPTRWKGLLNRKYGFW